MTWQAQFAAKTLDLILRPAQFVRRIQSSEVVMSVSEYSESITARRSSETSCGNIATVYIQIQF